VPDPIPDPVAPAPDPIHVARPSRWWEWSGFHALLLALAEALLVQVEAIRNPGTWGTVALIVLPVLVRLLREKATGEPVTYRMVKVRATR